MAGGICLFPAGCNFGPQPGCRFPCHCADGGDCDSLTGECGGSGQCEESQPQSDRIETGWTGPGCQIGTVYDLCASGMSILVRVVPMSN